MSEKIIDIKKLIVLSHRATRRRSGAKLRNPAATMWNFFHNVICVERNLHHINCVEQVFNHVNYVETSFHSWSWCASTRAYELFLPWLNIVSRGVQLLRPQCEINFANKEQHEETHRVTGYVAGGAVETFGIYHFWVFSPKHVKYNHSNQLISSKKLMFATT